VSERADVIVIGAGLGGLLCAALLARRGARVVVLEREPQGGGRLRTYTVDGFSVDCGTFLWPNKYLDQALAAAGATGFEAFTIPFDRVMRIFIEGGGGRPLVFPWPGLPEWPALLEAAAAVYGSVDAFRALETPWKALVEAAGTGTDALAHLSVDAWLARHVPQADIAAAVRRTVMLFGSIAPGEASVGELIHLVARGSSAETPALPQCCGVNRAGGVAALVASLTAACRAAGADLRLASPVEHVVIDGGRVHGVAYRRDGQPFLETLYADTVVCNVPAWDLFAIAPERHFPPTFVANARHYARVGESINVAVAFRGLPVLRATGAADDFPGWTRLLAGPDRWYAGGMMWTSHAAPQNAPAGSHLLQATKHVPRGTVRDAAAVEAAVGTITAMVREIYADGEERLLWRKVWVTHDGTEYMVSAVPRPPLRAPGVHGLYLVGETVAAGAIQMDNAARAALEVAGFIRPA
jgi:phytoene dehydrogenase-like protein